MIKTINHNPLTLAQPSTPATTYDQNVVEDLIDTFNKHRDNCVGMAANMIGINKNIIIVEMGFSGVIMINPEIISKNEPYQTSETCLSIDGEKNTTRYQKIVVSYLDRNFKPQRQEFTDLVAQIIQHEVDHCNGILI